jgi:hypothetical protein
MRRAISLASSSPVTRIVAQLAVKRLHQRLLRPVIAGQEALELMMRFMRFWHEEGPRGG